MHGPAGSSRPAPLSSESLSRPSHTYQGNTYNTVEEVRRVLNKRGRKGGLVRGALIEHAKFGRGRVLSVEKVNNDLKVTVQFPGLGVKKLLQSYAHLRPL